VADLRPSFVTLEDVSSQNGVPLHRAVEGDAAAGKNAHGALVAKRRDTGVLRYIPLSEDDAIPVTFAGANTARLADEGSVAGSTSFQVVATLPLTNDAVYTELSAGFSCFRNAIAQLVQIDDSLGTPVETIHAVFRCGPSDFNGAPELRSLGFTAGAVGDCILVVRAKQLESASSDISANLNAFEQV
jgi:hypothetical protein